jgi:hypothetical protein
LIQHMKSHERVWFATGSEVARWCLERALLAESVTRFSSSVAQAS